MAIGPDYRFPASNLLAITRLNWHERSTAGRWTNVLFPFFDSRMVDRPAKSSEFIGAYAGPEWTPWAYCSDEQGCGHNARIDIAAIVAKIGDVPAAMFRAKLRCSKCGARARQVIGHR